MDSLRKKQKRNFSHDEKYRRKLIRDHIKKIEKEKLELDQQEENNKKIILEISAGEDKILDRKKKYWASRLSILSYIRVF